MSDASKEETPTSKNSKNISSAGRLRPPKTSPFTVTNLYPTFLTSTVMNNFKEILIGLNRDKEKIMKNMQKEIIELVLIFEKKVKVLSEDAQKKIMHFKENEMKEIKNLSEEELTKIKISLTEYLITMQEISENKLKRLHEFKLELQKKVINSERFQSFFKFFDEKMELMKKVTEKLLDDLSNSEVISKNFQNDVERNMKVFKTSFHMLFTKIKEKVSGLEEMSKTLLDKKARIETFNKFRKLPNLSKITISDISNFNFFKRKVNTTDSITKNPLIPLTLKDRIQFLHVGKHFNSESIYGRTNVAKATYLGLFVWYLYRKVKNSKSQLA